MRHDEHARGISRVWSILLIVALVFLFCLVSLSLYAIWHIRLFARDMKQCAQFHAIGAALELHANEFEAFPPSDANDPTGNPYCGAMKLGECVMGRDLRGFHPDSVFRADGLGGDGIEKLYPDAPDEVNRQARDDPYFQPENANAHRLIDIYGRGNTGPFDENVLVLCDTFGRRTAGGMRTGMPILYYRAHVKRTAHDVNDPDNPQNIYDYRDNHELLALGVPGKRGAVHPLSDPRRFYMNTQNDRSIWQSQPYGPKKFILISAGRDGLYGTQDDICNFEWEYRE